MTVTRFAPSPTCFLHVGNLRAAVFNWLIARQAGGTFILRIDDTDPERSEERYVDAIREELEWLGLTWDREERQSARLGRYEEVADTLRADGRLYEAVETPVELDLKRKKLLNMGKPPVYDRSALALSAAEKDALRAERGGHWRFKLDHERIAWTDGILGDISIDAASVSDPVLIRGDGQMLYTMASIVDDTDMGITHVVRGLDHVTNTATQIQMIEALGHRPPAFAHHSLLTGPKGEKLSKRDFETSSLRDLRAAGIDPMAVLSLMARLGSSKPVELTEDLGALVAGFELSAFGAAPTKFDMDDLKPMTARLLHAKPFEAVASDLAAMGVDWPDAPAFWEMARENVETLADVATLRDLCLNGAAPLVDEDDRGFVAEAFAMLPEQPWDSETWATWTSAVKDATGRKGKGLFMPLRRAITGMDRGPDIGKLLPLLRTRPTL